MTGPVLADRVMRARRQGTCPLCRGPVRIGQQIARMGPGCWVHSGCLISAPPATSECIVSRIRDRVVVIRMDGHGLLLDLSADDARQLGRQLLDAGRTETTTTGDHHVHDPR